MAPDPASLPEAGVRGAVRAAWYRLCDATDVGESLVINLLTGGAATAACCALAGLAVWAARAAVRAGRRRASASVGALRPMA